MVVLLIFAFGFGFTNAEAKKIFKWVDEEGNTHFGDAPPTNSGIAQEVRVPKTPTADPSVSTRLERTERMLDSFEHERTEKREQREALAAESKKRLAACEKAEQAMYKYEHSAFLYTKDEAGNRTILGDEEYAEAMASAQADVEKWCD